jgi:hypothetical protein
MKKSLLFAICLAFSTLTMAQSKWIDGSREGFGQEDHVKEYPRKFDMGFGLGLDYGGLLGGKISLVPFKYVSVFGSLGYHLVDFGWQVGGTFYFIPKTNTNYIRPYFKAMYGTNRVIMIEGAEYYNKNYKGATPGIGCEFRFGRSRSSGLNIDINIPIESQEFKDDWETIKDDPAVVEMQDPFPIAFSIGYHFEL